MDDPALETLRDAIQAYLRADGGDQIVTGFLLATESATLRERDENYVHIVGTGSYATRVGLAHIALTDTIEGDDE